MTNHRNDERTVRCPVEGCDAEKLARGIHLHVRQSAGDGHGPQGDTPDHIDFDNLETVGTESVAMDYPDERDTENVARLCPYCAQPCQGKNGVLIHLGQMEGRQNHPPDAADLHSEEDFPIVEVDERGNIISVADEPVDRRESDSEKAVSRQRVYHLIAEFMAHGDTLAAQRVRRHLLGVDIEDRSLRENLAHDDLFDALVIHAQAGETDHSVTAAVEKEGVMVACRGESAFYNAPEARDVAAGLERATSDEPRHEEIADLIEFLRYGADRLEEGELRRGFHEELAEWR
jgi:hypothetical protein